MKPITMFSFGYYGWGNAPDELVKLVDAVERSRGNKPPIFVDTRIQRSVRAEGFHGAAFEELLGPNRYRWMKSLGNKRVKTKTGPRIQIADPSVAEELLELAITNTADQRRVVFFCGCLFPRIDGKVSCHRTRIATLLLAAARRRGVPLQVIEWPGGTPTKIRLDVDDHLLQSIKNGRWNIPVGRELLLAEMGGLSWGSIASLHSQSTILSRLVGPGLFRDGEWQLPILWQFGDGKTKIAAFRKKALTARRCFGLEARNSV